MVAVERGVEHHDLRDLLAKNLTAGANPLYMRS